MPRNGCMNKFTFQLEGFQVLSFGNQLIIVVHILDVQVVFLVKGPIYLVCISCTEEPYESLRGQLELIYGQVGLRQPPPPLSNPSQDLCVSLFDMLLYYSSTSVQ